MFFFSSFHLETWTPGALISDNWLRVEAIQKIRYLEFKNHFLSGPVTLLTNISQQQQGLKGSHNCHSIKIGI